MSVLIDYLTDPITNKIFGARDGTVNFRQPVYLDQNKRKQFRVLRIMMSPSIPNVYNYGGVNTTTIKLSRDGGTTWVTCLLKNGIYTIKMFEDAINDVGTQSSWWLNAGDYGYVLSYNPATQFVYVTLDSTKLTANPANQLCIDFSISQTGILLGFSSTNNKFITDGLHNADLSPQVDWQGQYVEVFCSIIQGCRWINGQLSSSLCRVPIVNTTSEIIFPSANTGMISPLIFASIPSVIQSMEFRFVNQFGRPAVFLYGGVTVELEIIDV